MPRARRQHVSGGLYHVTLRGNHRESLFGTGADRDVLTKIVRAAIGRYGARVHAYCLMTNHVHFLVKVGEVPLGKVMHQIATPYSRYRHRQLFQAGHLFERRHFAKLVEDDTYFMQLLRYIHLNPVDAGMVHKPGAYRWSSHRAYTGEEESEWITTEKGLSLFATNPERARVCYNTFIEESLKCRTLDGGSPTLAELARRVCVKHGVVVEALRSAAKARVLTAARDELLSSVVKAGVGTVVTVAEFLGRDPSTLARRLKPATATVPDTKVSGTYLA